MGLIAAAVSALVLAADGGSGCALALDAGRGAIEKAPTHLRVKPVLALIGRSCSDVDEKLAKAATEAAAAKSRVTRARLLAAAQSECAVVDAVAPAESLGEACAPGAKDPQGGVLKDLDVGTYVFVRALRKKLGDDVPTNAELVLSDLVLSAALEGEAARKSPARK